MKMTRNGHSDDLSYLASGANDSALECDHSGLCAILHAEFFKCVFDVILGCVFRDV
jgi:hypothetical protein